MDKAAEMTPQSDDTEARTAKAPRKKAAKRPTAKKLPVAKKKAAKKRSAKKAPAKRQAATKKTATKKTAKKKTSKKRAAKKKPARKRAATKKAVNSRPAAANTAATPPSAAHEHRLTPQTSAGAERRTDERLDVPGLLEVDVEMFGYQRDAREFGIGPVPDASRKIQSFGATVNLSLNGMCAVICDEITVGSHCLVRFVNAGDGVRPELRWGLVMRCEESVPGKFEVGVKFDSPLDHLDASALLAVFSKDVVHVDDVTPGGGMTFKEPCGR